MISLILLGSLPTVTTVGAQELATVPELTVVAQDPWLQRSGRFNVQVRITAPAAGYRLVGDVGAARGDMSEVLAASPIEQDDSHGRFIELDLSPGTATHSVALNVVGPDDPYPSTDIAEEIFTLDAGVYPLELQLLDPDGVVDRRVVTHLPFLGRSSQTETIDRPVGLLVDLRVPPQRTADGRPRLDAPTARRLDRQLDALASFGDVDLSVQVNPETVSALVETRAGSGGGALSGLTQLASTPGRGGSELLGGTYVGFDEGAWLAAGFDDVLRAELDAGLATLDGEQFTTSRRLVALGAAADETVLARCFDFGRDRVVLAQPAAIETNASTETKPPTTTANNAAVHLGLAPRLVIELPQQVTLPAADTAVTPLAPSPGLWSLDAYRVVAALLVDPVSGRNGGAQLRLGPELDLDGAFASTLLRLLAQPGPLRATTISQLFDEEQHYSEPASWSSTAPDVPDAVMRRGQLLAGVSARLAGLRSMLDIPDGEPGGQPAATGRRDDLGDLATTITTTAGDKPSPPDDEAGPQTVSEAGADTLADELEARLLLVPAEGISAATAGAIVSGVIAAVDALTSAIVLPSTQSFRVTAHRSTLPFVLLHQGQRPLRVALRMSSPEVEFEGANPRIVVLQPGANDVAIPIRTRRSGEFDLTVEVTSPDGALVMGSIPVKVQSRAISGVGLLLSIGALVFLVVWWARNARRRARSGSTRHRRIPTHQHVASPVTPTVNASRADRGHLNPGLSTAQPSAPAGPGPASDDQLQERGDPALGRGGSPPRATVGGPSDPGAPTAALRPSQRQPPP